MPKTEPGPPGAFWGVASRTALIVLVVVAGLRAALLDTGFGNLAEFLFGALSGAVVLLVALALCRLLARLLGLLPVAALVSFAAVLLAILFINEYPPATILRTIVYPEDWSWPLTLPHGFSPLGVFVLLGAMASVAGFIALAKTGGLALLGLRHRLTLYGTTSALLLLSAVSVFSLWSDGEDPYPSGYRTLQSPLPVDVADPSLPGAFAVASLSYGAGENRRRPEFGAERDLESRTVDASALLPEWKGVKKKMRESYWGFGLDDAPLNALVWAPEGDGPFPLVLIVHGNHGMEDVSDPGYAYLGELLASRGFITVSVDENYINGSWSGDFRGREMPARAWFLLEHLKLWRDWNAEPAHRFANRVDMNNIALIGHSRGGEAVPIAYLFNALPHYPDDATVPFDYGFNIQSLIAIAQVDQRYHRRVEIEGVNFLALQGSYDSDEPAFHGLRQFNRTQLGDDRYRFKTGIYVHGANHGQFNSTWGRKDLGPPGAWLLNLAPIIPGEDQRQIAKVYIAAFLEATLRNRQDYLPLFRDPRVAADWLPDHAYVNQFMDNRFVPIANFDDDLNVLTATADGARIAATDFALWREEELRHRDERLQGTNAVVLGWRDGTDARYQIDLPASFWSGPAADAAWLTLSVSGSTESLPGDDDEAAEDSQVEEDGADEDNEPAAPQFMLEARASNGSVRSVNAAEFAALAPPLRVQYLKSETLNKESYKSSWEPVLQHLEIPLDVLRSVAADGTPLPIESLSLRFAGVPEGVVIVDDIGVRRN